MEFDLHSRGDMPHEIIQKHIDDYLKLGWHHHSGLTHSSKIRDGHPSHRVTLHFSKPSAKKTVSLRFPFGLKKHNRIYFMDVHDEHFVEDPTHQIRDALDQIQTGPSNGPI